MKAFKMLDEVPIFFFANGLMIKGFPFYPYYSKQAQAILSDILDGYFPYDLKKNYPEGVPLKPVDFSEETYNNQFKVSNIDADDFQANPKFKTLMDLDGLNPMSKQEFLNQLPINKIVNGNIVPIREELEKRFQETQQIDTSKLNSGEQKEPETHVDKAIKQGKSFDPSDLVSLRIRTETGKQTILLKVLASDTISIVYKYIRPYLEGGKGLKFELRTSFPNRHYTEDETKTLKELGLAPSSALIVRKL